MRKRIRLYQIRIDEISDLISADYHIGEVLAQGVELGCIKFSI